MYVVSQAIAQARIFSARHSWLRWSLVGLFAATAGVATHRQLAAVEAERATWGDTIDVIIAARDLSPDESIAVDILSVPVAMAPVAALTTLPDGARLRQRVTAGEILTDADITAAAGPAASAASGTAVVAVADPMARNVAVGLQIRVSSEGIVLADDATIVSIADDVVYVAVPERDAPMVAAAAHAGLASLIFLP